MKKEKLTSNNIIKILKKHKDEINKYRVKKIGLFGSFLKGNQHKRSNLDFLVVFDEPTFDNYMELKFLLEKLFKKKVDLVIEENLKSALKYVKEEAIYAKWVWGIFRWYY